MFKFERIDQLKTTVLKALDVSGGKGKPMGVGNARNLCIRQAHGAAKLFAMPLNFGISTGGSASKIKYPLLKCLRDKLFETAM